jgi:hypothetical protein
VEEFKDLQNALIESIKKVDKKWYIKNEMVGGD